MTRILDVLFKITMAFMPVALGLCLYTSWVERTYPLDHVCKECPEPQPRIEDHVAAIAQQECWQHQECVTWNWLKEQGLELICAEQDRPAGRGGKWTPRNYYNATVDVPCSRVVAVKISDRVEVRK